MMHLNKREIFCWLCLLTIITSFAFVFSIPSYALDPRIAERLAGYVTEDSDIHVIEDVFEKDAYTAGLPPEKNSNKKTREKNKEDIEKYTPDFLDSGLFFDSGFDPQQKLYDDVSGIRQSTDIVVYFLIPLILGVILIFKFCFWFYSTFIESAWNK